MQAGCSGLEEAYAAHPSAFLSMTFLGFGWKETAALM